MVEQSILFAPEVDERALDQEVKQIDQSLDQAGEITPQFDDGALGDLGGGGGGGPGGIGAGGAAGAGALASRIPKPIAGVTAASALPVALAGGVGVGLLSAMHGASARLQTSTQLLGQAWSNVWRPIGDSLDKLFIRDAVMDVVGATQEFEETWRSGAKFEAIAGLLGDIQGMLPTMGFGAVVFDAIERGLAGKPILPDFTWPDLPDFQWPNIPDFTWPDVSLPDSFWPELVLPDWVKALTDQPQGDGGGGGGSQVGRQPGSTRTGGRDGGGGGGGGGGPGGRPRVRQNSGGGSIDPRNIETKLDEMNRNLKRFAQEAGNVSLQVDGQQFGQLTTDTRHDSVFDTDPLV